MSHVRVNQRSPQAFQLQNVLTSFALLLLIAFSFSGTPLEAQDSPAVLQEEYLRLRNTDPAVEQIKSWRALGERIRMYDLSAVNVDTAAKLLFNGSILYEKLLSRSERQEDLQQAISLLETLVRKYPSTEITDDALVRLGDLHRASPELEDKASSYYEQILNNFPDSDAAFVARQRLRTPFPAVQREQVREQSASDRIVVLDPGHGGEDFGAKGYGGLLEKEVALLMSKRVAEILSEDPGIQIVLTRTDDSFVPLLERTQLANELAADVFISLHANASDKKNLRGFEVFYLDNADDQASKKLAERENASLGGKSGDLQFILSDLIQTGKLEQSVSLAQVVHDTAQRKMSRAFPEMKWLGVKKAPFYVLVGAHMACVLIEMLFVDHPEDARLVVEEEFREMMAQSLAEAIRRFLQNNQSARRVHP